MKNIRMITIEPVIKSLRIAKQLSQEELSKRSGLDTRSISNIERDEQIPSMDSFCSLAEAFDMRGSELLIIIEDYNEKQSKMIALH